MYIIHTKPRILKLLRAILEGKGYEFEETKFSDYVVTSKDPSDLIPSEFKNSVKVQSFEERHFSILKNAGIIDELFPVEFLPGVHVEIKAGRYEGCTGIVRVVRDLECEVVISIWGRIVKEVFKKEELEILEAN